MSFRFVGTALSILGTGAGASGYYLTQGTASPPPAMVVPVTDAGPAAHAPPQPLVATRHRDMAEAAKPPETPPPAPPPEPAAADVPDANPPFVFNGTTYWQPRVFVGPGSIYNPVTGALLTREEQESGWVDGPRDMPHGSQVIVAVTKVPPEPVVAAVPEPPPAAAPPQPHKAEANAKVKAKAKAKAKPSAAAHRSLHPQGGAQDHETAHAPPAHPAPAHPTAEPAAAGGEGGWHIHLASYRSAGEADQGWTKFKHTLSAVLGALTPDKATVDIKGKGSFVRLLAGPFTDRATAERACAALAKAHQYCRPMGPGQEAS